MKKRDGPRRFEACSQITDNLMNGVWRFDVHGTTIYTNPIMASMLGCTTTDLIGTSIYDVLSEQDVPHFKQILKQWKTGQCARLEMIFRRRGAGAFIAECGLSQVKNPDGDSGIFLVCVTDITRRATAEDALRKSQAHLEQRVNERTRELRKTIKKFRQEIVVRKWTEEELRRNQSRLNAIVEDQVELVCRFQPNFTLTFLNDSICIFWEKDRDSLMGSSFLNLIPTHSRQKYCQALHVLSPDNMVARTLVQVEKPKAGQNEKNDVYWLEWSNRALFDDSGQCVEIQAVGRDVTARIQAEERAQRARNEADRYRANLEAIFRSIPDAILTVDKDLRVIESNQAIAGLCCEAREMTEGKSLLDISGGQVRPCMKILLKTLNTHKPVSEYRVECSAGVNPNQVMLLNCSPLLDAHGKFSGAVLVIRDITRLTELERRLDERSQFENIIGKSLQMQKVFSTLEQLVDLDTTVLITGESGTGKELIVDALHYFGSRDTGPLIKVNCSALPEGLLESELFGHVQGAFTGAVRDKIGRFQAAEKGTIFLDEIGDISPSVQLKLLRVLEQKEYERVGDSKTLRADVRVLAATNCDLREKIRSGEFRDDLYYRLRVMGIHLPPLRERDGDIPILVEHFLHQFREQLQKDIVGLENEVMDLVLSYPWPGNVRELKHTLEHACILCPGGRIALEHLPHDMHMALEQDKHITTTKKPGPDAERALLFNALEQTHWNKAKTARLLNISRPTLYRRMRRFGL